MYERFEMLLAKHNCTVADVCKATGISHSNMSSWKNRGGSMGTKNLQKIADYFGVSIDYLLTGELSTRPTDFYIDKETSEFAQQIYENKELRLLFEAAKDAKPEDLKTVYTMLKALKKKDND